MVYDNETARVLVVDDEGPNRYSIIKTLQRVGYMVEEAENGEQAVDFLQRQDFDVILSDIRMPGLDGIDLLRRIKEKAPDVIVILMTGYASLETAVEALRLGAHDYLIKPSSSQDIRQSVLQGIERARNLRRRRQLLDAIKKDVFELSRDDYAVRIERNNNRERESWENGNESRSNYMSNVMQLGALTVYPGRYQIAIGDEPIELTPTEFDILLYLAAHRGRVVPCTELVREVRGYSVDEAEAREVIRPHVSNLRRKLKGAGQDENLVVNVRGIGYRLNEKSA